MFSRTVRSPYPEDSPPETMLICFRMGNGSRVTSCPATAAYPEVGRRSVARILIRVVCPAPFGPSMPNSSPSLICRSTLSNARVSPPFSSALAFLKKGLRRLNSRVSCRVSTASVIVVRSCPRGARSAGGPAGSNLLLQPVPCDVPGDLVPHLDVPYVGELVHLLLVVGEVPVELLGEPLDELDGHALDVGRPDIAQREPLQVVFACQTGEGRKG